jgi:hypothetical protein
MSDSRPPTLQRAWHAILLLLAIVVSLWLVIWILSKIWIWLVAALLVCTASYVGLLLWRRRRDRW